MFEKFNITINNKIYFLLKILIIFIIVLYFINKNCEERFNIEGFNIEGEENINSLFSKNNMTIGNLFINGTFNMIPRGSVVAWTKQTIPKGWAICDGTNGTPDLRGRFIVSSGQGKGLSNRKVADNGGEENHLLIADELPSHSHIANTFNTTSFLYKIKLDDDTCGQVLTDANGPYQETTNPVLTLVPQKTEQQIKDPTTGKVIATVPKMVQPELLPSSEYLNMTEKRIIYGEVKAEQQTANLLKTKPHNNMPPYYILYYIMKL